MISESNFSRGYSSFWIEYFPWLNSYCQSINKYSLQQIDTPLNEVDAPEHRAINNTIAFFHYRHLNQDGKYDINDSKDEGIKFVSRFPRNSVDTYAFTKEDQGIINSQVKRLSSRYGKNVIINPFFPGCGILDNCFGDIIHGERLVEIKAGDRHIVPSDIKQLIVYAALNWISTSKKYDITDFEIYNPRVGYSWTRSIDELLVSITDEPKEDVFDQLAKYLVIQSEDIEIG